MVGSDMNTKYNIHRTVQGGFFAGFGELIILDATGASLQLDRRNHIFIAAPRSE
jgi:hypothetical protein